MAWEKEYENVDMAAMEHVVGLIDRSVTDVNGEPKRFLIQVPLDEHLTLDDTHQLKAPSGKAVSVQSLVKQKIQELETVHARARGYAKQQGLRVMNLAAK